MYSSKFMTLFDYLLLTLYYIFIILIILMWYIFRNLKLETQGVSLLQGGLLLFNKLNSILFIKLENLKKSELIDKIQEIDSKKHLEKSTINKLSLIDITRIYNKKLSILLFKMFTYLSKLTLVSFFIKILFKFKLIRFIWILFSSFITFVFGLAYSEIYGFKVIFDGITEYYSFLIEYIHCSKYYQILTRIFSSIKGVNEELIKEKTNSIEIQEKTLDTTQIKDDFSSEWDAKWDSENKRLQTRNFETNTEDIRNSSEVEKPFYLNGYFILTFSIVSLSLVYYYWDNISELISNLIERLKNFKPDNNPDNNPSGIRDIEVLNFEDMPKRYENLCGDTKSLINKIEQKWRVYESTKRVLPKNIILNNDTEFIGLFEQLRFNYNEHVDLFNKLDGTKLADGTEILKFEDRTKMLLNINKILSTLNKGSEMVPNYTIDLSNLHQLDIDVIQSTSPKLVESALEVQDLSSKVEETWGSSSPSSDSTIRANIKGKFKNES